MTNFNKTEADIFQMQAINEDLTYAKHLFEYVHLKNWKGWL